MHNPVLDRSSQSAIPAPTIVAVVGPPGCGKSTLIRSLVRRYTKHSLSTVEGPITVVAGKQKRLTFLEGNCRKLPEALDVAKVADLVLLMIDASFGFEMETFEFLNCLQSHGMPKVIGVLTHLDSIKEVASQRRTKKTLKQRFWAEIYPGAKLFYFSGCHQQSQQYLPGEVLALSRFVSAMKFRPLQWHNTHPYLLVDRVERDDQGETIFFGYTRGTAFRGASVHLPGVGDLQLEEIRALPDPCPFPDTEKKKSLKYRERLLYAPMSDVSGILYDKDAVYVTIPNNSKSSGAGVDIPKSEDIEISLLSGGVPLATKEERRPAVFSRASDAEEELQDGEAEQEDEHIESEDDWLKLKKEEGSVSDESSEDELPGSLSDRFTTQSAALIDRYEGDAEGEQQSSKSGDQEATTAFATAKAENSRQMQRNRDAFLGETDPTAKNSITGVPAGSYVRCRLRGVPVEFLRFLSPSSPIVIGGLLPGEEAMGYVQVRLKRHRWCSSSVLKSGEPLIFSAGWRRFQSVPIFSMRDAGTRNRMLKYTPQHMHCVATFWGPLAPPNSGILAVRSLDAAEKTFRISATGLVLEVASESAGIVKKLKLIGQPLQIHQNTAFVGGMFTSNLEVARFQGASLRTVSGIRGSVKRALASPEGAFRAIFEDRIQMSDLIFLRAWFPVPVPKFYLPMTELCLPTEQRTQWCGARLNRQVRAAMGIAAPSGNPDSHYHPIERPAVKFAPLVLPRSLQKSLPFASKPKESKRAALDRSNVATAVIRDPQERATVTLLQNLATLERARTEKRSEKALKRASAKKKEDEKREEAHKARNEGKRKAIYISQERATNKKHKKAHHKNK